MIEKKTLLRHALHQQHFISVNYLLIPPAFSETAALHLVKTLPEPEQLTFHSKVKPLARFQYLFGRLLIRRMYQEYSPGTPFSIALDPYGKPYIAGQLQMGISIAHSGQMVVAAMNPDGPVGLDVELVRPIRWEHFREYFLDAEWHFIHQQTDPLAAFFDLWTRKEAIAKADGRGIGLDFQSLDILQGPAVIEMQHWTSIHLALNKKFAAALAYFHEETAPAVYVRILNVQELMEQ